MAGSGKGKLDHYECDGQLSIFDFIERPEPIEDHLPCDTCGRDVKGCCDYDYINNNDYCVLGDKWIPKAPGPFMNKPENPEDITDDYIRENPTCFYVTGHYLDREQGWHKVPDELPNFTTWQLVDVVLYGKQTGTPWMEHEKWEAKDWSFRSVDDRRNTETTEVMAWKLSELENTQDLENVTLEELNKKITEKIGIKFEENPKYPGEYVAKIKGGYTLDFSFSTYMTEDGGDGKKMILLGWSNKKGEGGGSPGDSIEEAVEYFKKALRRIEEDKHKKER